MSEYEPSASLGRISTNLESTSILLNKLMVFVQKSYFTFSQCSDANRGPQKNLSFVEVEVLIVSCQ